MGWPLVQKNQKHVVLNFCVIHKNYALFNKLAKAPLCWQDCNMEKDKKL